MSRRLLVSTAVFALLLLAAPAQAGHHEAGEEKAAPDKAAKAAA